MLNENEILRIILHALDGINEEREADDRFDVGPETPLFGTDSSLDSLALVSLIVDVEAEVSGAAGRDICLTDDRAMSRVESPFRTVRTLHGYVLELLAEGQ